jgi:hypothetical protein
MVSEPWCEVGAMPKAWCAHCRGIIDPPPVRIGPSASTGLRDVLAPERPRRGPIISASFRSWCASCGDDMNEGDEICAVDGVGWCHEDCWEAM